MFGKNTSSIDDTTTTSKFLARSARENCYKVRAPLYNRVEIDGVICTDAERGRPAWRAWPGDAAFGEHRRDAGSTRVCALRLARCFRCFRCFTPPPPRLKNSSPTRPTPLATNTHKRRATSSTSACAREASCTSRAPPCPRGASSCAPLSRRGASRAGCGTLTRSRRPKRAPPSACTRRSSSARRPPRETCPARRSGRDP